MSKSDPLERHYTDPRVAAACIAKLIEYGDLTNGDRVLDPCVGRGAFANAVKSAFPTCQVTTIDIDPEVPADIYSDYRTVPWPAKPAFDLVATNPPFSLATTFIELSVSRVKSTGTVALFLLLQFLGSKERKTFFDQFPTSSVDLIRPRPSCSDDGASDMREYALFRWVKEDLAGRRKKHSMGRLGYIDWDNKAAFGQLPLIAEK
jgi:hypothetical protein